MASVVTELTLAAAIGLTPLLMRIPTVSKDGAFQRKFNAFYRVRRDASWRQAFYRLLQDSKAGGITFARALKELKRSSGRIEASFSSKLVATIDPTMPVIDRFVLKNLGFRLPLYSERDREKKVLAVYERLCAAYAELVASETGCHIRQKFHLSYGDPGITDLKILDLVLWQIRSEKPIR